MEGQIVIEAALALVLVIIFCTVSFLLGYVVGKYRERIKESHSKGDSKITV